MRQLRTVRHLIGSPALLLIALSALAQDLPTHAWTATLPPHVTEDPYGNTIYLGHYTTQVFELSNGNVVATGNLGWPDYYYGGIGYFYRVFWELDPAGNEVAMVSNHQAAGAYTERVAMINDSLFAAAVYYEFDEYWGDTQHSAMMMHYDGTDVTSEWYRVSHEANPSLYPSWSTGIQTRILPSGSTEIYMTWWLADWGGYDIPEGYTHVYSLDGDVLESHQQEFLNRVGIPSLETELDGSYWIMTNEEVQNQNVYTLRQFSRGGEPIASHAFPVDVWFAESSSMQRLDDDDHLVVVNGYVTDQPDSSWIFLHEDLDPHRLALALHPEARDEIEVIDAVLYPPHHLVLLVRESTDGVDWNYHRLVMVDRQTLTVTDNRVISGSFQSLLSHSDGHLYVVGYSGNNGMVMCFGERLGVEDNPSVVANRFAMSPAFPNPFNPATSFTVDLPTPSPLAVTVYDLLGRPVSVLHKGPITPGQHRFTFDATGLPSGTYLLRARAGDEILIRRITLVK